MRPPKWLRVKCELPGRSRELKTKGTYDPLHVEVRKQLRAAGRRTDICEVCGIPAVLAELHTANRTNRYQDLDYIDPEDFKHIDLAEWKTLCVTCHRRHDANHTAWGDNAPPINGVPVKFLYTFAKRCDWCPEVYDDHHESLGLCPACSKKWADSHAL